MKRQLLQAMPVLLLSLLLSLLLPLAARALPFTFTLSTAAPGGVVSGAPAQTVGWGYSLVNTDTINWFVPTQLNASSFSIGAPDASYFDFPVLAPGTTANAVFDQLAHTGLYGVQIFPFALPGQSDSGFFTLSGEWWNGNPLAGGVFLQASDVVQVPLTLEVAAVAALPLPGSLPLLILGMALLLARQRARQKGPQLGFGLA